MTRARLAEDGHRHDGRRGGGGPVVDGPPRVLDPRGALALQRLAGNRATARAATPVQRLQTERSATVPSLGFTQKEFVQQYGAASFASNTYKAVLTGIRAYEKLAGGAKVAQARQILEGIRTAGINYLRNHGREVEQKGGFNKYFQAKADGNELKRQGVEHLVYRDLIVAETKLNGNPTGLTDVGKADQGSVSDVRQLQDEGGEEYFFKGYTDDSDRPDQDVQSAAGAGIGVMAADGSQNLQAFMANRAVAMSVLDELLQTGMIPKTQFAVMGGNLGTLQKGANKNAIAPQHKESADGMDTTYAVEKASDPEMLTSSRTMRRQLNTLQFLDAVAGQVDRHPGNYLVRRASNGDVQIEAIDNDLSFGISSDIDTPDERVGQHRGLPTYIDDGVVERALQVSVDQVATALRPLLPPAELDATLARWARIRNELQNMQADQRLKRLSEWQPVVANTNAFDDSYAGTLGGLQASSNTVDSAMLRDKPRRKKVMGAVGACKDVLMIGRSDWYLPANKPRFERSERALIELQRSYPDALTWDAVKAADNVVQQWRAGLGNSDNKTETLTVN